MTARRLTDDEKAKLDAMNDRVSSAIDERTEFLDALCGSISEFKIGDSIYDIKDGRLLGTVSKICRWHRGHHEFDRSASFYYEYLIPGTTNCHDNTSRQYVYVGSKQDYINKLERELNAQKSAINS